MLKQFKNLQNVLNKQLRSAKNNKLHAKPINKIAVEWIIINLLKTLPTSLSCSIDGIMVSDYTVLVAWCWLT